MTEKTPEPVESLAEDLAALSNEQRLRMLHLLTRPRYAEELASDLDMSRQSVLKHIEKLEERGFVRSMAGRRATGPVTEFVVVPQRLFAVGVQLGDLGKLEPEGGPQKRVVERTQMSPGEEPSPETGASAPGGHLLILSGPNTGTRFPLAGMARWTIGREDDRDLRITHDPFVSGNHAEVQVTPAGFVLVDVFSSNGTFVNFKRLPRGGRVPIRNADVLGIGRTLLVYQAEG